MKKAIKNKRPRAITRREFVGGLAAAGIVTGAPALLRGRNLNDKLNIAFIGCGGRGLTNINELTIRPAGDAAPAGRRGNAAGPTAPHPDENVVVLCDVNQVAVDAASQRFPQAAKAIDLRRVFDKPDAFDAVVVSTAEHTHAFATYLALTHGKHVYCEKPLTYNIWEARLIRETAAKYPKLSTQMGNQGHASVARRTIKEILMTGVIGPVREVHVWADRAWGLQDFESADRYRPAAWVLQRHPDRRSVQGRDADSADHELRSVDWPGSRRGRSTRRTFPVRAGTAGGISATGR